MYEIFDDEKTCGNCARWETAQRRLVSISDKYSATGRNSLELAPCAAHAVELDAGSGGVAMLGPGCHCQNHAAAFEPSEDFLQVLEERTMPLRRVYAA